MAKSSTVKQLDEWLAIEIGVQLSPFVLTLKHVRQLSHGGLGFLFVYRHQGVYWIDHTWVQRDQLGLRIKPVRLRMDTTVKDRLEQQVHRRWYFYDQEYLYPVQKAKVKRLFDDFWFIVDKDPLYRPTALINIEMNPRYEKG